jgi:hypothetical protein
MAVVLFPTPPFLLNTTIRIKLPRDAGSRTPTYYRVLSGYTINRITNWFAVIPVKHPWRSENRRLGPGGVPSRELADDPERAPYRSTAVSPRRRNRPARLYARAPPARLRTTQRILVTDLAPVLSPPYFPSPVRARNVLVNLLELHRAGVPDMVPRPLPHLPLAYSVNR